MPAASLPPILPDGQGFECCTPSLLHVMSHANRLLTFKPPLPRLRLAHERLIAPCLRAPRTGKTDVPHWPPMVLDSLCPRLWHLALGQAPDTVATPGDRLLTLFLLAEELHQFQPLPWMRADIAQLADASVCAPVHAGQYQPQGEDIEPLKAVLLAHGYEPAYLDCFADVPTGWLAARWLSYPLPWHALLTRLIAPDERPSLSPFPFLAHLLRRLPVLTPFFSAVPPATTLEHVADWHTLWQELQAIAAQHEAQPPIRPVHKLILVEGVTETLVFPAFSRVLGVSLPACGILTLAAGGKKPVANRYQEYSDILNGPIVVVLDDDARDSAGAIARHLRAQDSLLVLEEGEIEDTYPLALILDTLNRGFLPPRPVRRADWEALRTAWQAERGRAPNTVETLQALCKREGLSGGAFDKARFAQAIAETVSSAHPVPSCVHQALSALGVL